MERIVYEVKGIGGEHCVSIVKGLLAGSKYSLEKSVLADAPSAPSFAAMDEQSVSWLNTYRPLLTVLGFILLACLLVQVPTGKIEMAVTMRYFMAGFFLTFSFFKLLDVSAFADAYMGYDLLAKRWRGWGFLYPFLELGLGAAYLANWQPFFTNTATVLVTGFSAIGVIQVVCNKQKIRCACLGAVFNLPMSTVTIIEDVGMVLMASSALWML